MAGMQRTEERLTEQQKLTFLKLYDAGYEYTAISERFSVPVPNVATMAREFRSEHRRTASATIDWDAEFRKCQAVK
ncbi:hypothetical protein J5289_16230 [Rhizobium sp. B230/85]|uniref:hypothetical protein n=1 Tax=unclassified Rhizobium TaxID=2613769 RepID=UPI001ADD1672|nr:MULTISPECIES: hypothetical protein [unclassified Rhizobium]MBO9131728.1 hypothetical protein [Rhizobium sp. B209b/85]QXZ95704.1 hypothetical protein J5289_16230 [Rhizobium sp. B230/85]